MVRLAQDFSLNAPLIDGHGNFGSPDDGPAASRYTEARMSNEAMLLVGELGEDTVDFRPNYDGSLEEPTVLPAAFPNLLVNGTSGIAVGMATNMIPHNLGEVVAAARWLITHPAATLDKLMEFVPGPDLPTGGMLLGLDEVRKRVRDRPRRGPDAGERARPGRWRAAGAGRRSPSPSCPTASARRRSSRRSPTRSTSPSGSPASPT